MTDQKKTLPFHITITHGDEIITDIDTDGILAAVSANNETEQGGTAVHLLTNCNIARLLGLIQGADQAKKSAIDSITKGLGKMFGVSDNADKD